MRKRSSRLAISHKHLAETLNTAGAPASSRVSALRHYQTALDILREVPTNGLREPTISQAIEEATAGGRQIEESQPR